jgi:hypothetical protein
MISVSNVCRMFVAFALVFGGAAAFAGDAGYNSTTCVSNTQRTVLTVFNDYTEKAPIYTLVLDGVPVILDLSDSSVSRTEDYSTRTTVIAKNGNPYFRSQTSENEDRMTLTIYQDQRVGTIAEHQATPVPFTVRLRCKSFWPNP